MRSAAPHEMFLDRRHRSLDAFLSAGAGDDRPGLRDRVDAALGVLLRTKRCAVIEVGAPVPITVPRLFGRGDQLVGVLSIKTRAGGVSASSPTLRQRAAAARSRTRRARHFHLSRRRRPGSCRRSSRPCPSAAGRVRRSAGSRRLPARSVRIAARSRTTLPDVRTLHALRGSAARPVRNGTLESKIGRIAGRVHVMQGGIDQP